MRVAVWGLLFKENNKEQYHSRVRIPAATHFFPVSFAIFKRPTDLLMEHDYVINWSGELVFGLPAVISLMTSVIALMMTHEHFDPNPGVFIRGDDLDTGKHFCTCEDSGVGM